MLSFWLMQKSWARKFLRLIIWSKPSKKRVAQRKGCSSLETLVASRQSAARAGPFDKSKKRLREGDNIATTTRSPGTMPSPPLSRYSPIKIDSLSTNVLNQPFPMLSLSLRPRPWGYPYRCLGVTYNFVGVWRSSNSFHTRANPARPQRWLASRQHRDDLPRACPGPPGCWSSGPPSQEYFSARAWVGRGFR